MGSRVYCDQAVVALGFLYEDAHGVLIVHLVFALQPRCVVPLHQRVVHTCSLIHTVTSSNKLSRMFGL